MDVEFDSVKDAINRDKSGVSLAFGARIVDHPVAIELPSSREIDGEIRYKALAPFDGGLWTAVFVRRGTTIRFISVRKSNDGERRLYKDRVEGRSERP